MDEPVETSAMIPKFARLIRKLLDQPDLVETLKNSAGVFAARFGGALANFLFIILLARALDPTDVGFVITAMSLAQVFSLFTSMNMESGSVRHLLQPLTQGDKASAAGFIVHGRKVFLLLTPMVLVILIALLVFGQYANDTLNGDRVWGIIFTGLSVPLLAMLRIGNRWGNALSRIIHSVLPIAFFRPVILVALVAVLSASGTSFTSGDVLLMALIASLVAVVMLVFSIKNSFGFMSEVEPDRSNSDEWMKTGLYLSVTFLLLDYFQNIAVVVSAFGLSDIGVAQLAVALRFVGFLRMGLTAVGMAISPRISRAVSMGENDKAQGLLSIAAQLNFWPAIVVATSIWVLAPYLMRLFGQEYAVAADTLRVFALLPCITAFYGPSILLLNISGLQKHIFRVSALSLALLCVSMPVAGAAFGPTGAAIAAVAAVFVWESALYLRARNLTGLDGSIVGSVRRYFTRPA